MEEIVPRNAGLLEGAVRPTRGWGLNQPRSAEQGKHETDDRANELLPAKSHAATSEVQLISKDGADRKENPHDQHER